MFSSPVVRLVLAFALLCLTGEAAHAIVRTWVSPAGNDSNPCTRDLPCRNFTAAITAVDAGGEVVALDSAGYGAVSITKAVAILAPAGVHAAIAPTAGDAIAITAGPTDSVSLRNLYLNSQGATNGIVFSSGQLLSVENTVVSGFSETGLSQATSGGSKLFVTGSVFRGNGNGFSTFRLTTPRSSAVFRGSSFVQNSLNGVFAYGEVNINVDDSAAYGNGNAGFWAAGGTAQVSIENSVAVGNTYGMFVDVDNAIMRVSNSVANNNSSVGFYRIVGTFESRGNNTVRGNGTNTSGTMTSISGQ